VMADVVVHPSLGVCTSSKSAQKAAFEPAHQFDGLASGVEASAVIASAAASAERAPEASVTEASITWCPPVLVID
jgi:hypothetical protein